MTAATDALAAAALQLTEAMRSTAVDPLDAIRILTSFVSTTLPSIAMAGQAAAQQAISAVFRRSAMTSIAMACADYQPSCSADAIAMIDQVGDLLDAEIIVCADAGQSASYTALRDLRHAVIADLRARSANLPDLVTVNIPGNLPSLAMAYRLYGDTTREPGMVARAIVTHPGFMPPSFEALSS